MLLGGDAEFIYGWLGAKVHPVFMDWTDALRSWKSGAEKN
jgi:hypothetical protein